MIRLRHGCLVVGVLVAVLAVGGPAPPVAADQIGPHDDVLVIPPSNHRAASTAAATPAPAGTPATIEVMVVHPTAAAERAGGTAGLHDRIGRAVADADGIFARSGVPVRVGLAAIHAVGTPDGQPAAAALRSLQARGDGSLDEVHDLRRTARADVVALWMDLAPGICGMAYLMGPNDIHLQTAQYAFMVLDDSAACQANHVLAHELGHLLGAQHDRDHAHAAAPPAFPYAYAHLHGNGPVRFRTVMSYPGWCPEPCPTVAVYSTPHRHHHGHPVGTATADNARALTNTAQVVARYGEHVANEVVAVATTQGGLYTVTATGRVVAHGTGPQLGDASHLTLRSGIVAIAATPTGDGYWLAAADGGVFTYGNATFHGSLAGDGSRVSGIAVDSAGRYVLVTANGHVSSQG